MANNHTKIALWVFIRSEDTQQFNTVVRSILCIILSAIMASDEEIYHYVRTEYLVLQFLNKSSVEVESEWFFKYMYSHQIELFHYAMLMQLEIDTRGVCSLNVLTWVHIQR